MRSLQTFQFAVVGCDVFTKRTISLSQEEQVAFTLVLQFMQQLTRQAYGANSCHEYCPLALTTLHFNPTQWDAPGTRPVFSLPPQEQFSDVPLVLLLFKKVLFNHNEELPYTSLNCPPMKASERTPDGNKQAP